MHLSLPLEGGLFSSVAGLPLHPLVVHLAVIVLPVAAAALVALVIWPRLAQRYGWLTMGGLVVGTIAAFVAKESGEALAEQVGEPAQHAAYGDVLPLAAIGLLVLSVAWFVLQQRDAAAAGGRSLPTLVTGLVAGLAALATIGLTVLVGHSGAQAVWGDAVSASAEAELPTTPEPTVPAGDAATPTPTPTPTKPSPTPSTSAPSSYTLAQVAKHASATSCWSVVNGNVYDLTRWINRHPGGASRILGMCGKDATSAFEAQHGGQGRPERELKSFRIGSLD
ncbi:MAG: cytochrome b5-like heme/steroid binding domain-containing protein [Propionicimonas sp.]